MSVDSQQSAALNKGLEVLGLSFSNQQKEALVRFAEEFRRWNRVHNLSAIDSNEEFISLHLMDSLSVVSSLLTAQNRWQMPTMPIVADLGAGGGLPGIPLAIALPNWRFVLVEAVKKKAAFLQHVKGKLNLTNVEVVGDRIESLSKARPRFADATISRAFSELRNFVNFSEPLLKAGGIIFAMKSQKASEELLGLPEGWGLIGNEELHVPNLDAQRCLLTIHSVRK